MQFEWDANKDRTNHIKHGISFETAREIWNDPNLFIAFDITSLDEERWVGIGRRGMDTILVVVHATRRRDGETVIRIISARKASRRERAIYKEDIFG